MVKIRLRFNFKQNSQDDRHQDDHSKIINSISTTFFGRTLKKTYLCGFYCIYTILWVPPKNYG